MMTFPELQNEIKAEVSATGAGGRKKYVQMVDGTLVLYILIKGYCVIRQ